MKKWIRIGSIFMAIIVLLVVVVYDVVSFNASGRTFDDIGDVPPLKYGLLVATSPITPGGARNFYFDNRIKAADELYKSGKVDFIIVYEGTRTLNSIAKAKMVYGLDSLILISQRYHNERAIYLADKYGIHAVGYNAQPSKNQCSRIKNTLREYLARVKMFIDVANMSTNYVE